MKLQTASVLLVCALIAATANAAGPFKKISGDRLLYTPAKVIFPARVGLFTRTDTHQYDSSGRDVSARYLLDRLIISDVYAYPVGYGNYGKDLPGEFRLQQGWIRKKNRNVKLVSQGNFTDIQGGQKMSGLRAEYQLSRPLFNNGYSRCGSQLYVFRNGDWFIAGRFSYPIEKSQIASKHIGDFLARWQWRQR